MDIATLVGNWMLSILWDSSAPLVPVVSPMVYVVVLAVLLTIVVLLWLANWLSKPHGKPVPADYDNRWPGYPLRKGDPGLNIWYKGAWSTHPTIKYDATTPKGTSLWLPTTDVYPPKNQPPLPHPQSMYD